jgi:hypothetical protein
LSNSVIKLSGTNLAFSASFKDPQDFTLNCGDSDLASGGPILVPGPTILSGGKQGHVQILNPANMASVGNFQATYDTYHLPTQHPVNCFTAGHPVFPTDCFHNPFWNNGSNPTFDCVVRESDYPWSEHLGPNIHGAPAFFSTGAAGGFYYTFGEKDFLRGYAYTASPRSITCQPGLMSCNPNLISSTIRAPEGMPGGFISVSANGTSSPIVWSMVERVDGQFLNQNGFNAWNQSPDFGKKILSWLIAADGNNLNEIYRDPFDYPFVKFVPPTIAAGKVFRATVSSIDMFVSPQSYLLAYGPLKTQSRYAKIHTAISLAALQ